MKQLIKMRVIQGFQSASGLNGKYKNGTVGIQIKIFKEIDKNFNIDNLFIGTLNLINLDLIKKEINILKPDYYYENIKWDKDFYEESFSFIKCMIFFKGKEYKGLMYYPHPSELTKHIIKKPSVEVFCEFIEEIEYGDLVILEYDENKVFFS